MSGLRVLSAKKIINIFSEFGFKVIGQKGSHIKLNRDFGGVNQSLVIPNHKEIDKGTTKAIYNQGLLYISEIELSKYFYTNK